MTTEAAAPHRSARVRNKTAGRQKPKIKTTKRSREEGDNPGTGHWRVYFLEHLIQTSNVTAAASYANTVPSRAYKTRRQDPVFAAQWDAALNEGYRNLEMDVLAYLRHPNPDRKLDVASAIRLLTLHRQNLAQIRARDDGESEQDVLDSIDRMIDEMRNRDAANSALLAEEDADEDSADEDLDDEPED